MGPRSDPEHEQELWSAPTIDGRSVEQSPPGPRQTGASPSSALARRWFLRPPFPEYVTLGTMQAIARLRLVCLAIAIAVNVLIWALTGSSPALDQGVLRFFLITNTSLLVVNVLLSAKVLLRPGRRARFIHGVCTVIDAFTVIVWVQVTGTVSSYFIAAACALILGHRLGSEYGLGVVSVGAFSLFHVGAFAFEELGILRPAGLFVADLTGTYSVAEYRWVVMISILGLYLVSFVMGNFVVLKLREKDSALRAAREELLRLGKDPKLGRLSGMVLPGQIEIAEVFGRGGMGEVYAGRRITDNRPVAVKVLHAHQQQPLIIERFRREVEAARLLPRTFVAEVLDVGCTDEGYHYIVMERLEGEDLGAYLLRRDPLTLEESATLCRTVATIIDAAHAAGIIHRDLKPSNIFLVGDLSDEHPVRLLDFGISRLRLDEDAHSLTATAEVLGSPGYIAPEQALGQPASIGPPTDVFALGAVIYRALTGSNAFPSRSIGAAVYEALYHRPKEPSAVRPGLPPAVDDVLAVALARSSEDRFQRAGEMADALEVVARGASPATLRERAAAVRERDAATAHTFTGD